MKPFCKSFIFLLLLNNVVFAQSITLVDLNNEILPTNFNYKIAIKVDKKSSYSLISDESVVLIPEITCDSLIEVIIEGPRIKSFYNQYYCEQFNVLDTIQLSDRKVIKSQTPRLFLGNRIENDSLLTDQLWLKDWLFENDEAVNGISFLVNSSEKLTSKEKRLVKNTVKRYCQLIGKEEFKDKIVFKNAPYISGQEDLFLEGNTVTRRFIENQNTYEMKCKAEKYSLVVTVLIDWKR
jgi:hypothetical protein